MGNVVRLYQPKQKKGTKLKLSRNRTRPWVIVKRQSNILYQIQHSKTLKPKIVHADNLKPFFTRKTTQIQLKLEWIQTRKSASLKCPRAWYRPCSEEPCRLKNTDKSRKPERTRSRTLAESDRAWAGEDRNSHQTRNTRTPDRPITRTRGGRLIKIPSRFRDWP